MILLAIETSCDETAIAVLKTQEAKTGVKFTILSNQIASQIKIHAPFGGVVPNLAKREHQKNLPILLKRALNEAGLNSKRSTLNAIAVTCGPGLEPALWVGVNFAQELAKKWKFPLVAVNHLEGHIYSPWVKNSQFTIPNSIFPLLTLIVSGGHTELVLSKKHLDYKVLGETLDDAAGEAFDKVGRMLDLPFPGGPEIARLAQKWKPKTTTLILPLRKGLFPRPMINSKDLNFSFSGLKTAVLYYMRDNPRANKTAVAYEFQQAVIDVLVKKTLKAAEQYHPKTVALGGGVAANKQLRSQLGHEINKKMSNFKFLIPELTFTGDNAAMIAVAAYFKARKKQFTKPSAIKAQGNLSL